MSAPENPSATKVAYVTTGELNLKIDSIWAAFWPGGINNPLEVIVEIFHQVKQATVLEDAV